MRSRITLATIEAAAIDCERWSPLTSARPAQGRPGGTSRPSASASFACTGRPTTARRMASRLAFRILLPSMPSALTEAIDTPRADPRIFRNSASRCRCVRRLESSRPVWNVGGIEHHRCRDHRSGQRAAAGLIHPRHRPQAFGHRLRLEGKVGSLDDFEEKRRIGTCASHGAARFASAPILRKSLQGRVGRGPGRAPSAGRGRPDGILSSAGQRRQAMFFKAASTVRLPWPRRRTGRSEATAVPR